MRRLLACSAFAMLAAASFGCHNKKDAKNPKDNYDADAKSGPDSKRSGAQTLIANKPHTDEISYINQDATDWYRVELRGRPNPPVLTTKINWDNVNSDVRIDVYDEFGQEIAVSPVRDKGVTQKQLLTQIDKPGIYYIRVSAPTRSDGTVYTMEALWAEPVVQAPPPPPVEEEKPVEEKVVHHRAPREPREPKPEGEKIQAHVVSAFRDGGNLMMYIDKGSAAGIRAGNTGTVMQGSDGDDALEGGEFKITRVIDANKSLGQASLRSLGKNNRVTITLGR